MTSSSQSNLLLHADLVTFNENKHGLNDKQEDLVATFRLYLLSKSWPVKSNVHCVIIRLGLVWCNKVKMDSGLVCPVCMNTNLTGSVFPQYPPGSDVRADSNHP